MSPDVSLHVQYKIVNAPIQSYPFPHIFVQDVFPADFYEEMQDQIPPSETFRTLKALGRVGGDYPDTRLVLPLTRDSLGAVEEPFRRFWSDLSGWLLGGPFGSMVLSKFGAFIGQRFGDAGDREFHAEALLVQDYTTYSLGPHTDSPIKVMSFLFYLPLDDSRSHLGTSIYVPKDANFVCPGGPHHPFDKFRRVITMPYIPNALFAFFKTDRSFHGVEPITDTEVRRDLLLYDIKVSAPKVPAAKDSA